MILSGSSAVDARREASIKFAFMTLRRNRQQQQLILQNFCNPSGFQLSLGVDTILCFFQGDQLPPADQTTDDRSD